MATENTGHIYYTRAAEEAQGYSRAVRVRTGDIVYLAGVVDRDHDGRPIVGAFEDKARAAFDRLREAVDLLGGVLSDVVSMTVFITDSRFGDEFVRIRREYFESGQFPASALITVTALAHPALQVEIQAVAVVDAASAR